jgi:toxin ParE1/3/4
MNPKIRRTRQVRDDLIDIYRYLHRRTPQGAERVFDAIEQSIRSLTAAPGIGSLWNSTDPRLEGMRVVPAKRYRNYLIFFRAVPDGIEVFRVVHGAQEMDRIVDEIQIDFDQDTD